MPIRVGLMGFGRIGRNLFRILIERDDLEVVAISDIADHEGLEYLLKYDTILGRFPYTVSVKEGHLYTRGRQIKMLSARNPGDVDWAELGVDVVIEATARSRTREDFSQHIASGARRVILCVPPLDDPDVTIVMGVNEEQLKPEHKVISNSSITTHCAGLILKILDKVFEVERLFFTAIHCYTDNQRLADVPANDLRCSRAAAENIIPTQMRSVAQFETLFPHLADKVSGLALNVPVPNGSLVDMVTFTRKPVNPIAANEVIRTAAESDYSDLIEYVEDPIVSSDVQVSNYSSTFDSLATLGLGEHLIKTIAWCDNGWGYSNRVVDLIDYMVFKGEL